MKVKKYRRNNMKNIGYQNELDFVELFNNKYLDELDNNSQKFLKELFDQEIESDEKIISWKNKATQKIDIYIKYKKQVKGISLKCGNSNSMLMVLRKKDILHLTIHQHIKVKL